MKSGLLPLIVFAVWVLLFAQNIRAALLVSQGKSAESQQVLRLLKRKELQDFLPGQTEDATLGGVPQTAYDQHWQERFNTIRDQLTVIGREYSTLVKKESRTDEENQRLTVLEGDLATAQQALQQLYQDISVAANPKLVRDLQDSGETLMQNLPSIEPGAVVIETIVLPDKYRLILTTPDVQIPAEYDISREALRKKVFAFRAAIDSRRPEPEVKALANELYQILFGRVVHIASHFKFDPDGNSNDSFLLLGNGKFSKLAMAQIAVIPNFFAGVELLTLSACETGVGDQASMQADRQGVEVEGLGVLAQRKGAAAVIASLWEVADVSTSKLMQTFYQCHASETATTKAGALRQAQLDLLLQTNGEYSHPFYWAPFVIIGNWQ